MRSSICSAASHSLHQRRMSVGDGGVLAFSIREVLAWCHPHRPASSTTDSPAPFRIARSRRATDSRAACAEDDGDWGIELACPVSADLVLVVGDGSLPHVLEGD